MKKRTLPVVFAALFVLAAALLIGLFVFDRSVGDGGITLPPEQGTVPIDPTPGISRENDGKIADITVDKDNVQRVIASLSRPTEYGCRASAVYSYTGGSKTLDSRWWVRPGICRANQYDAGGKLRTQAILTEQHVYLWGSEGGTYYEGSPGDFTADELGRVPSYEDVCALPPEQILDGRLSDWGGVSCISVRSGTADAYTDWYISLDNGLLMYAETREQDTVVYSVTLTELSVGAAEDSLFLLPNGAQPE